MKLLDFLQLPIVQVLRKFHGNILTNEGEGDNYLGLTLEKSQVLKSQIIVENVAKFQYSVNFFCGVVLFHAFNHNYHVWMENVLQI